MTVPHVSIPQQFLRDVVPTLTSSDELHASLTLFRLISETGNEESPIAEQSVLRDPSLRATLKRDHPAVHLDEAIFEALELAVGRGTFLRFISRKGESQTAWYYANTPVTRSLVDAMLRDGIRAPRAIWESDMAPQIAADPPNAFRVYEQNIGPLTPIIADQINTAALEYPAGWIEDAIAEAVFYNKRNWRYIVRILENWRQDGRPTDQEFQR